jgi:hypothetical protein
MPSLPRGYVGENRINGAVRIYAKQIVITYLLTNTV